MSSQEPTQLAHDVAVDRFLAAWKVEPFPDLSEFLPPGKKGLLDCLRGLVFADIQQQLARNKPVDTRIYFERFPEIWQAAWASELVHYQANPEPPTKPVPRQKGRREELPEPGAQLGDFEIVSLVGRGSYGRVYLARDVTLNRHVALKVSRTLGSEGQVLARLSHSNIVRVYREQIVGQKKLLAMQFVVGRTLADWIQARASDDAARWTFGDLVSWVGQVDQPDGVQRETGLQDLPNELASIPASVHLALGVAEALHHAHQRGVLHRDVKPSNILLDALGHPLLTDFNVAALRDESQDEQFGGTLAYMSPEHLKAMDASLPGDAGAVDVRSDIYSLGVVLYELLTGRKYWGQLSPGNDCLVVTQILAQRMSSGPDVSACLSRFTPSLASIITSCLAPLPRNRYQSAGELIQDLRNWLADRPLVFAPDPSFVERFRRWARRNQRRLAAAAIVSVAGLTFTLMAASSDLATLQRCQLLTRQALRDAEIGNSAGMAAKVGEAKGLHSQTYFSGLHSSAEWQQLENELTILTTILRRIELERFQLQFDEMQLASFTQDTGSTNRDLASDGLRTFGVLQHSDWESRPPFSDLAVRDQETVAENITELILIGLLQGDSIPIGDTERVAQILSRVPDRHRHLGVFKVVHDGKVISPDSLQKSQDEVDGFGAYLYGVTASMQDSDELAHKWFSRSIRQRKIRETQRFWVHYWDGYVCQRLGNLEEAIVRYGVCIGLRPDFGWSYFNLGLACKASGRATLAKSFLEDAIVRDPDLASAYVALAALQFQDRQFDAAIRACDRAIAMGHRTSEAYKNRAAGFSALGNTVRAIADLEDALLLNPHDQAARSDLALLRGD